MAIVTKDRLDLVATILMIVVSLLLAVLIVSSMVPPPQPTLSLTGAARIGSPAAPVVVTMFSDFTCRFCQSFAGDQFEHLKARYVVPGDVEFVFRHTPEVRRPGALRSAVAAACAGRQDRFWEVHDLLFANPTMATDEAVLLAHVSDTGVDTASLLNCLASESEPTVEQDVAMASTLEVRGTPTFFVGRRKGGDTMQVVEVVRGAQPLATFESIIEQILGR